MSSSERDTAVRRTLTALPFRRHASMTCPRRRSSPSRWPGSSGSLTPTASSARSALGAAVPPSSTRKPSCARSASGRCGACADTAAARTTLLIDRVLERGHGHPLLLAVVLGEIGRRAGLPVGIVGGARGHFVAHQRLTEPLCSTPLTGHLVDAELSAR